MYQASLANNTGGVFGPTVNDGHQSFQYRAAITDDDAFAQRLHYQSALDDDFMWRLVGQTRKSPGESAEFDYLQAEVFWQLENIQDNWQHGVRFDLRYRDDSRPHQFGFNWMHQFSLDNGWFARVLLLTTTQFGENSRSGVGLQARGMIAKSVGTSSSWALSWFSDYGTTSNFRSGSEQFHQLGPTFVHDWGDGWRVQAGGLFGVTNATPERTYRVWLERGF